MIYIVMGVSGCGKSTIGKLLATELSVPFYDADNFHPKSNVKKMSDGIPLSDNDRQPWLILLADLISSWESEGGAVLACSALKQRYRELLSSRTSDSITYVYLKGDQELLKSRLNKRISHYMPISLLKSQLDALEPPKDAIVVDIDNSIEVIIDNVLEQLIS